MADGLWLCYFEQLGNYASSSMHLPCCLLLVRMQFLPKMPPSALLIMSRVAGSDKLESSILSYMVKMDNGHGLVAHSS